MTARLYDSACHCRHGVVCITCLRWLRIWKTVSARRAAWGAAP